MDRALPNLPSRDLDELWGAVHAAGVRVSSQGQPRLHRPRIEESGLRIGYLVDPDGTQPTLIEEPGR